MMAAQKHVVGSTASAARRWLGIVLAGLLFVLAGLPMPALALTATPVPADQDRIEITSFSEYYEPRGDSLQLETAPGADGVPGRMTVRAATPGTNPGWIVFALRNTGDKPIERWVTAERYSAVGSGIVWPDLDTRRIEAVTPSLGFLPERIKSDRADLFRITLDPGQTVTYVAEQASERFTRIYLWKPLEYEVKARDRLLLSGVLLGITGLLAIFLTAVFAANHKAIFPSAALLTWCVLACLCVDFGFFHKLFQLRPEDNAIYRAATESAMAASFVVFLHTFLRIGSWHGFIRMLAGVWMVGQISLIAVAVIDPRLAATFARLSFAAIGGIGAMLILFLAVRGQDRALALVPTWLLLLVWIFAGAMLLSGRLAGDVAVSGLVAGLVLLVLLIGFTVTQFAFRSLDPQYGAAPDEMQLRSDAIESAGAATWEWRSRRDEIQVSPVVEAILGLNPGELSCKVADFVKHMHTADRERFNLLLWSTREKGGGAMRLEFRMRHADNSYRWFELDAASVPGADRRALRGVGLVRDITDQKRSQERLMHDAVHDSLTGLPNRALFFDRLAMAVKRAGIESGVHPTLIFIDIDKFKSVNSTFGLIVGDSLLLTIARRLARHLTEFDTLARVGGDQFALLLMSEQDPRELAMLAERVRRSLRSPIKIAGQDIVLTASIGIAAFGEIGMTPEELLKDAEIAMYRAKRGGADRIEIFDPKMRADRDDRVAIESDLRRALEKKQLRVLYQPIIYLPTEELAGFEALVRWEHPKHGLLNPVDFIPVAEGSDLIVKLGSYVLAQAAGDVARWHKELPRTENPLFVSVNISSRQLFRQDLIQEIRHFLGRNLVAPNCLRLEVTESLVMENPEQAVELLEGLRAAGAMLSLDDFGTGYSSLAYLQRFPFDTIKIDKDLVQGGNAEGNGSPIVRSIVALAQELGRKVVAEGVERVEDVGFLRSIGAEYAQGFYYGEPMSDRDVMSMLRVIRKSERKLQRRGFFRTKPKPADAAVAADTANGAAAPTNAASRKRKPGGKRDQSHKPAMPIAAGASPQAIAASLKAAEAQRATPARPRFEAELSAGAVRLRPRNPMSSQQPTPAGPPPQFAGAQQPQPIVSYLQPTPLRPLAAQMLPPIPMPPEAEPLPPFQFPVSHPSAAPAAPSALRTAPPLPMSQVTPNLEGLPPAIAASISRLANMTRPPPVAEVPPVLSSLGKKMAGE
jgi:diguanylate cyclase (GGDEF)-like protein/PAS domain S-box-containing protein